MNPNAPVIVWFFQVIQSCALRSESYHYVHSVWSQNSIYFRQHFISISCRPLTALYIKINIPQLSQKSLYQWHSRMNFQEIPWPWHPSTDTWNFGLFPLAFRPWSLSKSRRNQYWWYSHTHHQTFPNSILIIYLLNLLEFPAPTLRILYSTGIYCPNKSLNIKYLWYQSNGSGSRM